MFDPTKQHNEHELMELAITLAQKSISENDGRSHPMVGAVIARDGYVLETGFHGFSQGTFPEVFQTFPLRISGTSTSPSKPKL